MRLVTKYVNADSVPFAGASPPLDDCDAPHADYLVVASFALVPHAPGTPNDGGRTAALANVAVTNCITGNAVSQRTIPLLSDPPDESDAGDFESTPGSLWTKSAPATLAKNPPPFVRVARIVTVSPPFALVNLSDSGLKQGDELVDVAGADRVPRAAIPLTVTDVLPQYVQVLFPHGPGDPQPRVGDLIEPAAVRP